MKLTTVLLLAIVLQVSAKGFAQKLTLKAKNVSLKTVFKEIRRQTGYDVLYQPNRVKDGVTINADFTATPLKDVLDICLSGQPLTYTIDDKSVVIQEKTTLNKIWDAIYTNNIDARGRVVDETGSPMVGVTVTVKNGRKSTFTDKDGKFNISQVDENAVLVITFIGYKPTEISVKANLSRIQLQVSETKLDEVQVIAYGTTSKRLNIGNVTSVSGKDLNNAPVSNPLAALEGRVPGLIINQTSGVPGAGFSVQIRGRTRIDQTYGADDSPLFIIDGVPMATGNNSITQITSAISGVGTGGVSPFATINTGDIESIEVLKDAEATSIYGSRGANGVILITTKKGKAGTTRINLKVTAGASKAKIPQMLNTSEYVAMRKEAFRNDNKAMTTANAYDLLLWDTTRNSNLAKQLIGGTAKYTTAEGNISGGSELVTYTMGGSYYRETNVYPQPLPNTRGTAHVNLMARSANQKFTANFTGNYTNNNNQAPASDLSSKLTLPPNYLLYNPDGSLAWNEGGIASDNPLAYTLQKYSAKSTNLNANALLGYKVTSELAIRASMGYNAVRSDELRTMPKAAMNPNKTDKGSASFANSNFRSWIVEPQAEYNKIIGKGKLNVLAGGTLQYQTSDGSAFTVRDYTSDAFLGTLTGITSTSVTNPSSFNKEYKYAALFGRASYNYNNTYLIDFSGRRDGSSRFGPNYKYSNFGAVGAAWIFTNESIFKDSFLSYGKLRGSYGTAGNDKIGDYLYRDLYSTNAFGPTYTDSLAISPTSLFKPDLHWEQNKKLEVALELGFFKDRALFSIAWYRNRSSDPLVQYPLPTVTGFSSVVANLNGVVVQNRGWEFMLNSTNLRSTNFEWRTGFNLTLPQNKLIAYPGLAQSSYANRYILGRSLDLIYVGNFLGVDPETGLYKVQDLNNDGKFTVANVNGDFAADFDDEPSFYGGIQNDFRYKNFSLSVFMNFTKQYIRNWRLIPTTTPVGNIANMPVDVLKRWQKPGDITNVQKFTTNTQPSTSLNGQYAQYYSDAIYNNIFYMRLRTVALNYNIPTAWVKAAGLQSASIYVQGQNLLTFSPFKGPDPETLFIGALAPLRTVVAGFQINF